MELVIDDPAGERERASPAGCDHQEGSLQLTRDAQDHRPAFQRS
jgi:hypothetical protein